MDFVTEVVFLGLVDACSYPGRQYFFSSPFSGEQPENQRFFAVEKYDPAIFTENPLGLVELALLDFVKFLDEGGVETNPIFLADKFSQGPFPGPILLQALFPEIVFRGLTFLHFS
jgi:hypothetical protein